jgi:Carboxypeptidase regulatory-like domain
MNRTVKSVIAVTTLIVAGIGLAPSTLCAQITSNGSIVGTVTDNSGAVLPGVLVTATSPQLQVPQVKATTDAHGNYKILNLPAPGVYKVTFALQGFQAFTRGDLHLTVGFAAKVDAQMTLGSVTQSVVVTGASPVVDTVNNVVETTISRDQIADIPKSQDLQELEPMVKGVSLGGAPDVGASNMINRTQPITYNIPLTSTLGVEGINNTDGNENSMQSYMMSNAVQEAEYTTSGNNADVGQPGVNQVIVIKSGSNTFHGEYTINFQPPAFQGNNISSELAAPPQSLIFGSPLTGKGYYDFGADIGGYAIRNKLWFYFGYYKESTDVGYVNWYAGPNKTLTTSSFGLVSACWTCTDAPPAFSYESLPEYAAKVNYQLKPSVSLIGVLLVPKKTEEAQAESPLRPLPSDGYETNPIVVYKGEIQITRPRWILDGLFGTEYEWAGYIPEPASLISQFGWTDGTNFKGDPAETEESTGLNTGVDIGGFNQQNATNMETSDNFSYLPAGRLLGGTHQIKAGIDLRWSVQNYGNRRNLAPGNYVAIFNKGVPYEVRVYNYPFNPHDNEYDQSAYVVDNWSLKRITLNLGVRWDRYHAFYPQQATTTGQFVAIWPHVTEPKTDILTWTDVTPRVGAVWDVGGHGKTVVKGSYGMFGTYMGFEYPAIFDSNAVRSNTYAWRTATIPQPTSTTPYNPDLCGPTGAKAPVEYACDVPDSVLSYIESGADPVISSTGGTSQIINPNLHEPVIHEFVAQVERQLVPNMSVSAGYVGHLLYHLYNAETNAGSVAPTTRYAGNGILIGHPYSSYTLPATFTDAQTGAPVTVYTYPAGSGTNHSEILNNPSSRPDYYSTLEVGVTKRYSSRWVVSGSFWITHDHRWINAQSGINGSPNDDPYPLDTTWNWAASTYGTYHFPLGFAFSADFRDRSGAWGQRTEVFSGTGTNGQKLNQGSVTMNMGPFGQYRSTTVPLLNINIAKTFHIRERFTFAPHAEIFNVLNNAGQVAQNWRTTTNPASPTFGKITSLEAPRVARLGAELTF